MMDEGRIEFCGKMEERAINILHDEVPKPVTIFYRERGQQVIGGLPYFSTPKLVVKVPTPFSYKSDKSVPWNYTNQIITLEPQIILVNLEKEQEASVNDIIGTEEMTRSG